ncbi:phenylalanine--tRNA ligase subunit beta [Candidatus Parcubacteria bacterium]|jgi:phenylalanyl-tRNA synthetase beta chain|nr:phenylalanine--tRNA ligase subunit beta [Candidatus Parcubacteria bacterium]
MLVSYNWLKYYVDLPDSLTSEELGLKLTMTTVEVEGVEKQGDMLDGVVVGEILEIKKHPDADKLSVAQVDVGEENLRQIVFGQMVDMEVGLKVPVALAPTVLPGGNKIKKSKLRGVESRGMLCLDQEMGLAKEGVSIRFFDKTMKNGTGIVEALGLGDTIFDIDNKSMTHRPDLWGHYGMAREVAAAYNKKLKKYDPPEIGKAKKTEGTTLELSVLVKDKELCPRYMAVAIDGIKVGPSPEWMQKLLLAVGLRPINNIVDITNFILLDLGQPMHAFDKKHLSGDIITVRRAENDEKFITLDEQEHELTSDMLVIADSEKPVALAGVMGGMNSEISDDTTTIIFESANFDATNVRRTATKLGLRTDSSARFEKSLDPNNAELALRRAAELTLEICPDAKVVSNVADEKNFSLNQGPIELSLDFLNKKIGKVIEKKQVIKILEDLGFGVKDKKDILFVTVPTWRATKDISIPEDLVEEVSRVYGYGNIETVLPSFSVTPPERNELRLLERKVKELMSKEYGYTESINYSFVSPDLLNKVGLEINKHIELDNPIAKDRPYLRRTLLPNLFENIEKNTHDRDDLYLFEVGKVFKGEESGERVSNNSDDLLPNQDVEFACVYSSKQDKTPFYEISQSVGDMIRNLGVDVGLEVVGETNESYIHPGRVAYLSVSGVKVGIVAELHPSVQKKFGIDVRVGFAEINLTRLLEYTKERANYIGVPEYPPVLRDIAFVVDSNVMNQDMVKIIKSVDNLINHVELFDVFEGEKLGKDKKSVAYHITYLSKEKTLEAVDVDKIHDEVVKALEKEFKAEVRK